MVDDAVLASKLAAIRDAVARIREVLPASSKDLLADRTAREIVMLNLFGRLRAASGLRNLIAHQYGAIDAGRIFDLASNEVEDLLSFCRQLAQKAEGG